MAHELTPEAPDTEGLMDPSTLSFTQEPQAYPPPRRPTDEANVKTSYSASPPTLGDRRGSALRALRFNSQSSDIRAYLDGLKDTETGWEKIRRMNRYAPNWKQSVRNALGTSWVPILLLISLPLAWTSHFVKWPLTVELILLLLSLAPLAHMFESLGEQLALYCGQSVGDLIVITLSKCDPSLNVP